MSLAPKEKEDLCLQLISPKEVQRYLCFVFLFVCLFFVLFCFSRKIKVCLSLGLGNM